MDFNIKRIIRFYDRLSTRLITLTALWVTFIICAIGYQMYLSQQVQTAGAYQYEVGSLPARVYVCGSSFRGRGFRHAIQSH